MTKPPYPAADCPLCGGWVPCKHATLVSDPKELTGPKERWVSLESKGQALSRHLTEDCKGQ